MPDSESLILFHVVLYFHIYAFGRCFNSKHLTLHLMYTSDQFMHSLGIKPMTLVLFNC